MVGAGGSPGERHGVGSAGHDRRGGWRMDDAQREVVAFLRDPSSYPPGTGPGEVIETHASIVFLAGNRAYKLKRAVKYPYLDFSTVERRRAACTAELKLNRRTAPQLYLEVRDIGRLDHGNVVW